MPAVDRLFHQLQDAQHPNVLDVMAAISDIAHQMTDEQLSEACQFRADSHCRFCD